MLGGGRGRNTRCRATGDWICEEICWTTFLAGEFSSSGVVEITASDVRAVRGVMGGVAALLIVVDGGNTTLPHRADCCIISACDTYVYSRLFLP